MLRVDGYSIDHNRQVAAEGEYTRSDIGSRLRRFDSRGRNAGIEKQGAAAGIDLPTANGNVARSKELYIGRRRAIQIGTHCDRATIRIADVDRPSDYSVEFCVG